MTGQEPPTGGALPPVTLTRVGPLCWHAEMPWGSGSLTLTARFRWLARQRALRMYIASPEGYRFR